MNWQFAIGAGAFIALVAVIAFMWWRGREAGRTAEKLKAARQSVKVMKAAREVRQDVEQKPDDVVRRDLGKWVRPDK